MPYISTEEVKKRREVLKEAFPKIKFSVTCRHYSEIRVSVMEAPFKIEKEHKRVNEYCIKEDYKDFPEVRDFLLKIKEIIDAGNYTLVNDGDYGEVPCFYIHIEFGKWDRPYKQISVS